VQRQFFRHHDCHIFNALHANPASEPSLGMVIDGRGEDTSVSFYSINGTHIKLTEKITNNFSLGSIYAIGTWLIGYSPLKGEAWKLMGLAAYGKKNELLYQDLKKIYRYEQGKFRTSEIFISKNIPKLKKLIHHNSISKEDVAHTVQLIFEEYFFTLLETRRKKHYHYSTLYLSGGSALNSLAIGKLAEKRWFTNLVVPNGPSDDGNAIGAAFQAYLKENTRTEKMMRSPFLGTEITHNQISRFVKTSGLPFKHTTEPEKHAARLLHENKIIGWIQGRSEFGPRALGNRSILANPIYAENKDRVNAVVKFRESYRPFAPSILHENGNEYFEQYSFTPFMEKALTFKNDMQLKIPAVVHRDGTGRLQSVTEELNPLFHQLISEFHALSEVPVVLNTSYNVMGKPIANSIDDVMALFFNSQLDAVFIGNYYLNRRDLSNLPN
jgi:carbamoyltransferase